MNTTLFRMLRAFAWLLVSVITVYTLVSAWVNWTGARMYRAAEARLKADGESLDFRKATPEPVPEAENFCAIPALNDLCLDKNEDAIARRKRLETLKFPSNDKLANRPKMTSGATFGTSGDLNAWRVWLRDVGLLKGPADSENPALDVLHGLSSHEVVFSELATGLNRPIAQWTPAWRTRELPGTMLVAIPLPHYNACQTLVTSLQLRTWAAAEAGEVAKAHESLQIMARLSEANANDPFLIGLLVSMAGTAQMANALWEVCDAQLGSADDFTRLEKAIASIDYKRSILQAWRGELAASVDAVSSMKRSRGKVLSLINLIGNSGDNKLSSVLNAMASLIPGGWFDANAAVLIDYELKYIMRPSRDENWPAILESAAHFETALFGSKTKLFLKPYHVIASLVVPATLPILSRAAHSQCLLDKAIVACALERYRIEHGAYPDSLNDVKLADGKPLPLDVFSGKPLGYRKTENGKYALWSVGFDGRDDGGKRALNKEEPMGTRFRDRDYKGDWVWDFPATR